MKIHYAGGLRIKTKSGGLSIWLKGWPCCCSGDKAWKIAESNAMTMNKQEVTCGKCLNAIKREDAGKDLP